MRVKMTAVILLFATLAWHSGAHAWGRRGHATVCEAAALLLAEKKEQSWLSSSSFDLSYYCNVPDITWKKGDLYKVEWTNHFMDLEIFDRAFRSSKIAKPFEMDRLTFNAKFPEVKDEAGRAYWRITELMTKLAQTVTALQPSNLALKNRHELQIEWLVAAGAIGHYVGDLGQPLHVSENFDGQLTHQKGLHAFFEDELVDRIFQTSSMQMQNEVMKLAQTKWRSQKAAFAKVSELQLIEVLATTSNRSLIELLAIDRRVGRKNLDRAMNAHHKMIVDRMAESAAVLAELWRRRLDWKFTGEKFYSFEGTPAYIVPPQVLPKTDAKTP